MNIPRWGERQSNLEELFSFHPGKHLLRLVSTDVIVEPAWPNTANILEPEAGGGHPLAVGLLSTQHGQGGDVKTAIAPDGLGLDIASAHASVFGKGAAKANAFA